MANVAAVTMVYNERFKLPRWVDYYSKQLSPSNCYIIDHGSDDGSTSDIGKCQLIRIPRTTHDNQRRTDFVSNFVNGLLKYYSHVLYTDCDEIIVADPDQYAGIGDFCNKENPDYLYSIGVDVLHKYDIEPPLRPEEKITRQRSFVHFSSAMCKHTVARFPVTWTKGFHSSQYAPKFGGLFNFHLRYSDLDEGLGRLTLTREAVKWAFSNEGGHQKLPDSQFARMMRDWGRLPLIEGDNWAAENGKFSEFLKKFISDATINPKTQLYDVNTFTFSNNLYRIPKRFVGVF